MGIGDINTMPDINNVQAPFDNNIGVNDMNMGIGDINTMPDINNVQAPFDNNIGVNDMNMGIGDINTMPDINNVQAPFDNNIGVNDMNMGVSDITDMPDINNTQVAFDNNIGVNDMNMGISDINTMSDINNTQVAFDNNIGVNNMNIGVSDITDMPDINNTQVAFDNNIGVNDMNMGVGDINTMPDMNSTQVAFDNNIGVNNMNMGVSDINTMSDINNVDNNVMPDINNMADVGVMPDSYFVNNLNSENINIDINNMQNDFETNVALNSLYNTQTENNVGTDFSNNNVNTSNNNFGITNDINTNTNNTVNYFGDMPGFAIQDGISSDGNFLNEDLSDIKNMNDSEEINNLHNSNLNVGNNNIFNENNRKEIIRFENVVKEYRSGEVYTRALNGISLTIYEGQVVIFLGTSGAGKSTALNLLGGLDNVTSGRIIVDGDDIAKYNDAKMLQYRRDKLGYIFQFYNLIQTLTAKDNVELVLELCKKKRSNSVELLEQVGLKDRINNYPSQLSGGEQQRVSIARALAKEPRILICDEPTGALDHKTTRQVLELLINTAKQKNITLIIVTHNNDITPIADVVYSFRSGEIVSTNVNPHPSAVGDLKW